MYVMVNVMLLYMVAMTVNTRKAANIFRDRAYSRVRILRDLSIFSAVT